MDYSLLYFSVSNFRGFSKKIELRLDGAADYHFNSHLVENGVIKNALIYGKNGSGKTSLLRAIAHIVPVLTNNFASPGLVSSMDIGNSDTDPLGMAVFTYEILAGDERIRYEFGKNRNSLLYEEVFSNGRRVLLRKDGKVVSDKDFFPELKNGMWVKFYNESVSVVKFLGRSGLKFKNDTLSKLIDFAERFLLVRSVIDGNEFAGFAPTTGTITSIFSDENNVEEFRLFLKENGLNYQLKTETTENPASPKLLVQFKEETRDFLEVASSGTRFLLLVFYWFQTIGKKASLFCIDEFDAYFHDDCALSVFHLLSRQKYQTILTTHRTSLMSNNRARPDVLFNLENGSIKSFVAAAEGRELREAHNIEKMYRSGAFEEI